MYHTSSQSMYPCIVLVTWLTSRSGLRRGFTFSRNWSLAGSFMSRWGTPGAEGRCPSTVPHWQTLAWHQHFHSASIVDFSAWQDKMGAVSRRHAQFLDSNVCDVVLVPMRGVWSSLCADCWCHSTWKLFLEFRHLPNIQLSSGVCAFESCPSPHDWFSKVMVLLSHALTFPRCHCISNMVKWGESQQNLVKFGDSAIRIWWIKVLHWLPSAHPGSPAHCGRCLQRPQTRS